MLKDLFVIVGLGNPGKKYEGTRHNTGFYVIDELAHTADIRIKRLKHMALYGKGTIGNKKVVLYKPQTFMNSSGESVREILKWYKISLDRLIIVYDDIDIELGKIRVRRKGSAGTHNGMKSVLFNIRSEDFPRVRVGIGRPSQGRNCVGFVLGKFNSDERKVMLDSIKNAAGAVKTIITEGIETAMNRYNP